jgi:hypothetical protein
VFAAIAFRTSSDGRWDKRSSPLKAAGQGQQEVEADHQCRGGLGAECIGSEAGRVFSGSWRE